jgi:hypothetical protein
MILRKYLILNMSEIDKVNLAEICETSHETMRKSVNGEKVLVKWDICDSHSFVSTPENPIAASLPESAVLPEVILIKPEDPEFIKELSTAEGPYTHEEILEILSTPEWTLDISSLTA